MARFPIQLRYADTDQMGLIYFARHFMYADEAIVAFLKGAGVDLLALEREGTYVAVAAAEIAYERPLRYGESCEVEVEVERVGNTSLSLRFRIYGSGELKSHGKIVYVFVDREGRKVPVPPQVKPLAQQPAR